jgi:choline dehydrogenase-like flavoprotein
MTVVGGAELRGREVVEADVCVVGTGAGGAVVAAELAEGGMRVVMLEEGEHRPTAGFTARPRDMSMDLYRDAGQTVTLGNVPIVLPLGRGIGGTTMINSGTCFRTPDAVLAKWRERFGLEALTNEELAPCFDRVEHEIGVSQVTPELAGRNAAVVKRGADALGWSVDYLHRNARGCIGSGVCCFGCPTAAKQHVGISYVPRAWEHGAVTYTGCEAQRVTHQGWRASGVVARTAGGGRLQVRAPVVIVAAGTIGTPVLLERSGMAGVSGELGRNLSLHPATAVKALMDEQVDMAVGVPQSLFIDEFAAEGIMFEGAAGPPDYMAAAFGVWGDELRELMLSIRNVSQFGVMVSDESRGFVRRRGAVTTIRYDLVEADVRRFHRGLELLAELYWRVGAKRVFLPVAGLGMLDSPADLQRLRDRRLRARDLTLMAFHPLGTARAAARREDGVVDGDLRHHEVEGLHVADGSVVPSALGVNPQLTIMALATRLAFGLLGRPVPPTAEHVTAPSAAYAPA